MKKTRITRNSLAALAFLLAAGQVGAQTPINPPPALINFQGRLAKPDGTPVTDGTNYSITLSLWDTPGDPQPVGVKRWQQTFTNVMVRNGVFAVLLNLGNGFTSGNTLDSTLNNATYLQVQVGNDPALKPRQQLVSNAYALKATTVPDGSISISKLDSNLKGSILGGAAGGDLTGSYPNPQIRTDSSLLNKVSGTLLSIAAATSTVDQSQPTTTATVTSSAWQSFTPSTTGTLLEIDVQCGTTGAQVPATLSLYSGQGTNSTPIQTIPITINPTLGLQAFPITANVTGGQFYTWAIGSNNNLNFGYAGSDPYLSGQADLGIQFDYAFQTKMQVTMAPATQVNAAANLFQTGSFYLSQNASVGPMLVKQYDPFTSGTYNGSGRSGLFQAASDVLFGGMAGSASGTRSIRFGTWSPSGVRTDIMTILNSGNVGIGMTTPTYPLDVAGNVHISGSGNGIVFQDGTKQVSAAVVNGTSAGGDLTGTYPNPTIAANKVDNTKLTSDAASLNKVSGGAMISTGSLIGINGANALEFGRGVTGKQVDAGKIGYGILDSGYLNIVGAGPNATSRQVKIYAEGGLTLNGGLGVTGGVNIGGSLIMSGPFVPNGGITPNGPLLITNTGFPTVVEASNSTAGTGLSLINTSTGGRTWNVISSGSTNTAGTGKLLFQDAISGNTAMQVSSNGGITVPGYMAINGSQPIMHAYGWLNEDGDTGTSDGTHNYSLVADQRIAALEFNAFSDVRLKHPIGRSDAFRDLNTLLGIEVTNYTMRDTIAHGNRVHKKVLAQQVEAVYPQAVTRTTGVIPDIYQRARVDHGWVQLATSLKVGERVQLLTPKGGSAVYKVLDASPQGFRVELLNADEAFVYGREVPDLRTVDYEAIAMLNVSATQAMYQQLSDLKARVAESDASLVKFKAQNEANEDSLTDLRARSVALETRLAAMEAALNRLKTVHK